MAEASRSFSDRDNVVQQTLRAGIRAPPPEKPYSRHRGMGERGSSAARTSSILVRFSARAQPTSLNNRAFESRL